MIALFVPPLCMLFMFCLALWVQANVGDLFIPGTSIPWELDNADV